MRFLITLLLPILFVLTSGSVYADKSQNVIIYVNGISNSIFDAAEGQAELISLVSQNSDICDKEKCAVDLSYNSSESAWDFIELKQYAKLEKIVTKQALSVYMDTVIIETQRIKKRITASGEYDLVDNRILSIIKDIKLAISRSGTNLLPGVIDDYLLPGGGYGKLIDNFLLEARDYNTDISNKFVNLIATGYKLKNPLSSFEVNQSILLTVINNRAKNLDLVFSSSYRNILATQVFHSDNIFNLSDQLYFATNTIINANADRLVNRIKKHIKQGSEVVVVAHSQGNHVVQSAYAKIEKEYNDSNRNIEDYLQVVGLGVVASSSPNDTYLTWDEDHTVLGLYELFGSPLPPNFVKTEGGDDNDKFDHNFIKVYLASNIKGKYKHNGKGNISELPHDVQTSDYSARYIVSHLIKSSFKKMDVPVISLLSHEEITEGDTGEKELVFRIILDSNFTFDQDISVDVETKDNTAIAGNDYKSVKKTVTFHYASDERYIDVAVPIIGDTDVEEAETFTVTLSNATGAIIDEDKKEVTGLIQDDDLPEVSIIEQLSVIEGDSGTNFINIPVTLNSVSNQRVFINVQVISGTAIEGSDYLAPASTSLEILPGATGVTQTIFIVMDRVEEPNETFTVKITNVSGATIGNAEAVITIIDDDGAVIADTTPPVITLIGNNPIIIDKGGDFIDPGATAFDNTDGSISVSTSGTVNTSIVGIYTITYSATDAAGNSSNVDRTIKVVEPVLLPVITSITPLASPVRATVAQNFLVTGQHLSNNISMQLDDCASPALQAGGSDIQRTFRCTPLTEGLKNGVVSDGSVQKSFSISVEAKPDTAATGFITSPLAGSTHTTEQIDFSFNVVDVDGLKKVSLVFAQNGTPYVVCEDGTANECAGTNLTKTVSVNLADYGATQGQVNIGLWVVDENDQATLVDSSEVTWDVPQFDLGIYGFGKYVIFHWDNEFQNSMRLLIDTDSSVDISDASSYEYEISLTGRSFAKAYLPTDGYAHIVNQVTGEVIQTKYIEENNKKLEVSIENEKNLVTWDSLGEGFTYRLKINNEQSYENTTYDILVGTSFDHAAVSGTGYGYKLYVKIDTSYVEIDSLRAYGKRISVGGRSIKRVGDNTYVIIHGTAGLTVYKFDIGLNLISERHLRNGYIFHASIFSDSNDTVYVMSNSKDDRTVFQQTLSLGDSDWGTEDLTDVFDISGYSGQYRFDFLSVKNKYNQIHYLYKARRWDNGFGSTYYRTFDTTSNEWADYSLGSSFEDNFVMNILPNETKISYYTGPNSACSGYGCIGDLSVSTFSRVTDAQAYDVTSKYTRISLTELTNDSFNYIMRNSKVGNGLEYYETGSDFSSLLSNCSVKTIYPISKITHDPDRSFFTYYYPVDGEPEKAYSLARLISGNTEECPYQFTGNPFILTNKGSPIAGDFSMSGFSGLTWKQEAVTFKNSIFLFDDNLSGIVEVDSD